MDITSIPFEPKDVVKIAFDRSPNLRHLLKTIKELKSYRRIRFQGIGKAVETVDAYIERFVKYDIGDVMDIKHFKTDNQSGVIVKGKSFYLVGKHSPDKLDLIYSKISRIIRDEETGDY